MGEIVAGLFGLFCHGLFASTRPPEGEPLPTGERVARQFVLWSLVLLLGTIPLIALLLL